MATKNRPPGGVTRRTALTTLSAAAALALTPDFVSGQDVAPADTTKRWGRLPNALGARSPAENPRRTTIPTSSRTPLQDLHGTITPSDLHYERHHAGVAVVDPQAYRLTVHGMVDRPLTFTLQDLKRFPSVVETLLPRVLGQLRRATRGRHAAGPLRPDEPERMDRRHAVHRVQRGRCAAACDLVSRRGAGRCGDDTQHSAEGRPR